jgi:Uma2 family endonuclease
MAGTTEFLSSVWTAAELVARLGPIPLDRVRTIPAPGRATERDVLEIHDREKRLCELFDGALVEKPMGSFESFLAAALVRLIGNFVAENDLGIVLTADGMLRLSLGLVRIPDASFISWARLPGRELPQEEIWGLAPDLAVEIISPSNTREEMQQKLVDYFGAGVQLVWYVYPPAREVHVYREPDAFTAVCADEVLDGGAVLPGFRLPLAKLFARPGESK